MSNGVKQNTPLYPQSREGFGGPVGSLICVKNGEN